MKMHIYWRRLSDGKSGNRRNNDRTCSVWIFDIVDARVRILLGKTKGAEEMKKFPVISKRVISKNGRNFDVEIEKTYDGLSIYMRDVHSGMSDNAMISHVALSVMDSKFSDDYVLLVSYEVSKFEYRLYNHVDKPIINDNIRKFEEWDGDCR